MSIDKLPPHWARLAAAPPTLRQPTMKGGDLPASTIRAPKALAGPAIAEPVASNPLRSSAFTIPGVPVGKPRQTQSDKWKKRPVVVRYRAWADKAREVGALLVPDFPYRIEIIVYLPIPKTVSRVKRMAMMGTMHRLRGDADNFLKAAMDALFEQDGCLAIVHAEKYWEDEKGPRMEVTIL